jgi:glycerophosphoryl diester phosphodiesterase
MAQIEDLLNQASEIRNADQEKENTAQRVGKMLMDIIQHIAGFVSVEGLQAALADYVHLDGANLPRWDQSRVVPLKSMGSDLDNIDGGDWALSTLAVGDIVYNPNGKCLTFVSSDGNQTWSCRAGVIYVNLHSHHCYVWDATTQAMIEITDSSRPTIIDYRNNPPFAQVAIGESYYFESGSAKKIAIKTSSSGSYSFDPDPKKIYVFKDTCESMTWNATTRSWIAIGKNIEVVDNLTEGGRNKALSAEMGKQIKEEIDNLGIEGTVSVDDADLEFIDEDGNIAMRVAEGHIETAGFDSRQVATNTNTIQQLQQQIGQAGGNVQTDVVVMEDSEAAFDVSDESGNVVLRVGSDGHIETKGFNSNEVSGTDIFRLTKMTPNCIFHANAAVNGILGNTIASIREAYKKGYRWFEIDSKPCRDNGAILTHEAGQYINQSETPYTIYQKSDPTQTPIEVGTFAGYDSTDLAENYTWTASTYTDGVLTAEGKPMETLEQAIWHICHIRRCPLEVDRQTLTKAVQLKAFQYAKSLGVEHYLFFEAGSAGNVSGFSDWDEMPSILCSLGTTGYATDIVNVARDYKTPRNNIIFSYPSNAPKDDTTLKAVADAAHAVGCFALTWSYNTNDIDELRRWLRAGFDFALTNGTIVNTDI